MSIVLQCTFLGGDGVAQQRAAAVHPEAIKVQLQRVRRLRRQRPRGGQPATAQPQRQLVAYVAAVSGFRENGQV